MVLAAQHHTAGFAEPVFDAQAVFRAAMMALARPGSLQPLSVRCAPPEPLNAVSAALALALCDYETPVWLDPVLAAADDVATYLRFHTGAPVTQDPSQATFALIAEAACLPPLSAFAVGSAEYPDRSTTVILQVGDLSNTAETQLSGPGIDGVQDFHAAPLPPTFWLEVQRNHACFPRGVDILFAAPDMLAGLPRSTRSALREA